MCELSIFELEFSARGPLSLGAVGRRRRRSFFFGYSATGAGDGGAGCSYRAIASARRRATCARGCLRRVSTLRFSSWNFRPEVLYPLARLAAAGGGDFFFGYSATGAGDGGAGCQLPGHRERAAARDLRERVSTACVNSRFSSWNFRPEVLYPLARLAAAGGGFLFRLFGDWRW